MVIGGSAGAIRPLARILGALPPTLEAAVAIVIHLPDDSRSALARVLARVSALPVSFAEHGQPTRRGTIVVAPPGHHLLAEEGRLVLSRGAPEHWTRPAIDPLFRSAARANGRLAVSVLLSGALDDGVAGTAAIREAGGATLAQDPADAEFPDMPAHAIATGVVDEVLPAAAIGERIVAIVAERGSVGAGGPSAPPSG